MKFFVDIGIAAGVSVTSGGTAKRRKSYRSG